MLSCSGQATEKFQMANIKHLVIVMMENHSFDEYFGTFPGVSGFFDQSPAFAQPWGNDADGRPMALYPWRMSTFTSEASDTFMCQHQWFTMHQSVNPSSTYNQQSPNNSDVNNMMGFYEAQGQNASPPLMGYYLPDDIPYHWALASNFALCDNYFCSALSATDPNRLYLVGGTILPSDPSDSSKVASPPPGNVYTVTGNSEPPPVVGNPLTGAGPFDPQYDKARNAPNLITVQRDVPNYLAALHGE